MPTSAASGSPGQFRWRDGERLIRFGRGALDEVGDLLGDGYTLLSTARALAVAAPGSEAPVDERDNAPGERKSAAVAGDGEGWGATLVGGARTIRRVGPGRVDELAADLRPGVGGELLVALGGGRVIDTAKALAAAAGAPCRVAAIPTTLSGAEMTAIHRHATGVAPETPHVRPAVVVCDPGLAASQPLPELAASALNALGHAAEAPLTPQANPVGTLAAREAARRVVTALADPRRADRDALALGALLAGYAIDSAHYGLHHVAAQTLVRFAGVGHGPANAILLPHTLRALARRDPAAIGRLAEAVGDEPADVAGRLCALTAATRLRDLQVAQATLEECADRATTRPELANTPPPAGRDELLAVYRSAW